MPINQQKTWDYNGSISAGITGMLSPGRGVWQNVGIAAGGAGLGWGFGEYAPRFVNRLTGKEAPGFIFDAIGSLGTEFLGGYTQDLLNTPHPQKSSESGKEKEGRK